MSTSSGPSSVECSRCAPLPDSLITMRLYAEEKRSGTIELLLTSPLTDMEIILGKFFGE